MHMPNSKTTSLTVVLALFRSSVSKLFILFLYATLGSCIQYRDASILRYLPGPLPYNYLLYKPHYIYTEDHHIVNCVHKLNLT